MWRISYSANGLRVLTKTPVVLDTMIFLRMFSEKSAYSDILRKIMKNCNKIIVSTKIVKEWRSKSNTMGMSSVIILRKLKELSEVHKIKKCTEASIDKVRRLINEKRCKRPNDKYDMKFIEVAIASRAFLLTEDHHLLDLEPYNCGKKNLRIMSSSDYLGITRTPRTA